VKTTKTKTNTLVESGLSAETENVSTQPAPAPKKTRTRSKEKMYFGPVQEQAVVDYLNASDQEEKDRIFNSILKPAFTTMIESIIRRYGLKPPDEEFEETFKDTVSFLMTKISCFDPSTKFKAYSYCGTICKNYLLLKLTQYSKRIKNYVPYDNPDDFLLGTLSNDIGYSYMDNAKDREEFIDTLTATTVHKLERMASGKDDDIYEMTDADKKVGEALTYLMNNWEEVIDSLGSNKFNRSAVILFIEERTNLTPKEIRKSLKVYRQGYFDAKFELLNF